MPLLPSNTINILDPGLGLTSVASEVPVYLGCSQLGTNNVLVRCNTVAEVLAAFGEGMLSEALCLHLAQVGAPAFGMKVQASVAKAASAVTQTGSVSPPAVTISFDGYADLRGIVTINTGGIRGTATFTVSLDNGRNTAEEQVTVASYTGAGTDFARSGLTINFASGTYVSGDKYSFTCTAPMFGSANITAAQTALNVQTDYTEYPMVIAVGDHATGSAAATVYSAFDTGISADRAVNRFIGGLQDAGAKDTSTNVISAFSSVSSKMIGVAFGMVEISSAKGYPGFGVLYTSALLPVALRAAKSLISTDLARYADGSLTGVLSCNYLAVGSTDPVDSAKIITLKKFGSDGIFITRGNLKSPANSDFKLWQYRRLMDRACTTVELALRSFLNDGVRVKADGTIAEEDAKHIEGIVSSALKAALLDPSNASGRGSHVSAVGYAITRTNQIVSTGQLLGKVVIQPLAYLPYISTDIGFVTNIAS